MNFAPITRASAKLDFAPGAIASRFAPAAGEHS
jgi:hypothetical protein